MAVRRVLARLYGIVLAVFALLGLACALSYQSWTPVLGTYSVSYVAGVLVPVAVVLALQAAMYAWPPPQLSRHRFRFAGAVVPAAAIALGLAWAHFIPEPRTQVFVVLWLPALALLALYRVSGWIELLLSGMGPLALATTLFLGELPMHPTLPVLNWGDASSMAYLFPTREPFFGPGGRLRPNLRARLRSADYPGGALLETNADGFRNADPTPRRRPPNEYRVLSLGDSFSCGYGATQTEFFGALLEQHLGSRLGLRSVNVLSAEVSDPAYGLYYLERYGLSFNPSLVIYGLSGNDVMQSAQFAGPNRRFHFREDGVLEPNPAYTQAQEAPSADADSLVSEMGAWVYPKECPPESLRTLRSGTKPRPAQDIAAAVRSFRWLADLWSPRSQAGTVMPSFAVPLEAADGHKRLVDGYANLGHYYLRDSERTRQLNSAVWPLLKGFKNTCDAAGVRFLLVVFPQRYQVVPADWELLRSFWNLDSNDFDFTLFNRELAAFCAGEGIECVDLLRAFRAAAPGRTLYLPEGDMHFNRHGNEVAARVTAEFVSQRTSPHPRTKPPSTDE